MTTTTTAPKERILKLGLFDVDIKRTGLKFVKTRRRKTLTKKLFSNGAKPRRRSPFRR